MNFLKIKGLYFLVSFLFLIASLYGLFTWGLVPSIDFTGGTLLEYKSEAKFDRGKVEAILAEEEIGLKKLQSVDSQTFLIRARPLSKEETDSLKKTLEEKLETELEQIRLESVGPILGKELLRKTATAVILAALGILAYVAWQFKDRKFGVGAILAMFHDSVILLGSFSFLGHFQGVEVDTLFVTAVLTVLSFSVHDTVVVFDKIRENQKMSPRSDFESLANLAIGETLVRSLNNSFTIIFMLVALLLLGGMTIKWFVAALLIGTVAGTYSSTFIAVPLLVVWHNFSEKRKNKKRK
ncbi:protein translocase subunit SecF [Patescibacteria group bacterium]